MPDFLQQMAEQSEARCQAARAERDFEALWDAALDAPVPKPLVLNGFDLIAEVKTASPSEGVLRTVAPDDAVDVVVMQARAYEAGGAAAISVLTEPTIFGGSVDHLRAVCAAVDVPVMRKDFLVADYQVVEAREAGASGVLLIVRMLSDEDLFEMTDLCRDLGMFALLEAFDEADITRLRRMLITRGGEMTQEGGPLLLGLNCRNLADLSIDAGRFQELQSAFPTGYPRVAESGMRIADDVQRVASLGYELALVGTALMKAPDPAAAASQFLLAGRAARGGA